MVREAEGVDVLETKSGMPKELMISTADCDNIKKALTANNSINLS